MGGQGTGAGHVVRPRPLVLATPIHKVGARLHVARAIAGQQQQGGVLEPEVAVVRRAVLQGPCVTIGGPGPFPAGGVSPALPQGISGNLCRHVPPEALPLLALGVGQLRQRIPVTHAGQSGVRLPGSERPVHHLTALEQLGRQFDVGPQPVERSPAQAGSLRLINSWLPSVFASRSPDCGAGGVISACEEPTSGDSQVGVEPDDLLEVADGLVQPALVPQDNPEVEVGQG